jgi:exopolysaccharide biosynthesis polyprenyl glycosylphosphotransferase
MFKESERYYNNFLTILDVILSIIIFFISYYLRVYLVAKNTFFINEYLILALLIIPIWYVLLKIINLQNSHKIKAYSIVILEYSIVNTIGVSILYIFIFVLKLDSISRLLMFGFAFFNIFILSILRIILYYYQKKKTIIGEYNKNIILFADDSSYNFIEKIINSKQWGYQVIAIITNSNNILEKYNSKYKIINEEINIEKYLKENKIDDVIYSKEEFNKNEIKNLIYLCSEIGINFQIKSDFISMIATKSDINYFGETAVLSISSTSTDYFALTIKIIIDYIISFFALLFFLPFFFIIAIFIKIGSRGPVFFKQKRVGLRGRTFTMLKFRTMVNNAEKLKKDLEAKNEVDGPVFKIKNDPRITKIGKFLRKTSLDEFPQFINVLKGDMSIVGPRPPIKEEVEQYERWQLRRLSMKPGITCIWQVSGRNKISFEEWMKMDLQYIDNWSLKLDIMLIIRTINVIFKRTGQ